MLTDIRQPFFGAMGCTSAIVFTCFGAAYGTAKAGVGISAMGVLRPDLIVKSTLSDTRIGSYGDRGTDSDLVQTSFQSLWLVSLLSTV